MKNYSKLRELKRLSLAKLLPLKFPISMYIETTNRCNFRCRYCPMSLSEYPKISGGFRTMDMLEFNKICRDIQAGGRLKVLRFYLMGEPLLNPSLPEMIKMACEMKLAERTELTTNGVFLSEDKSIALINSGLDYLRVSISSVNQRRHEYITQTNISINQIYKNIERFKEIRNEMSEQRPFLYIKMIDQLNDEENSRFLQMYQHLGDEVAIEKPMNWDNYNDYDLLQAAYNNEKRILDLKSLYPYPKSVCPFPFYTMSINVNGDVTVCCVDWNKATRIGNVFETTLKSIWDGDNLRNFRRMQISKKRTMNLSCANCQFLFTSPDNLDNMSKSKIKTIIGEDRKG